MDMSQIMRPTDFNKIKVGSATLDGDLTSLLYSTSRSFGPMRLKREDIERAVQNNDLKVLRAASNLFFQKSGIYSRLCRYMAYLFRYDWFVTPHVYKAVADDKVVEGWYKACTILENSDLKLTFGNIALDVMKDGCYYGYKVETKDAVYLQKLPVNYCRARYSNRNVPAVEFNIKYFDDAFSDAEYRVRVLKMFPKIFRQRYVQYKSGKLPKDFNGDDSGWFLLEDGKGVKFNLSGSDAPLFASVIPHIIDLEEAQDLDKQKMLQQILRIIIQKLPLTKNFDPVFDMTESQMLHNNVVDMLSDAVGVEVMTTFADVDVADMSDKSNVSSVDQLDKVERTVYNEFGTSQNLFNTEGNIALEKSISNDESTMTNLLLQFERYCNGLLYTINRHPNKLVYKVKMLPTTAYNYKDMAKLYKEQTMLGFSKLLPQVALGIPQTSVIATAYFENELMNLDELFVAPQMSSTRSSSDDSPSGSDHSSGNEGAGRPELPDEEKSEKTIANIEAGG